MGTQQAREKAVRPRSSGLVQWVLFVVLALGLGGCAGLTGIFRDSPIATLPEAPPPTRAGVANAEEVSTERTGPDLSVVALGLVAEERRSRLDAAPDDSSYSLDARPQLALAAESDTSLSLAQRPAGVPPPDVQIEEYDPWEPFNESMFEFNRALDRWVLKPVAKGYRKVVPDQVEEWIDNGFTNISFVPRFINCVLQGKFPGAGRELARFVLNSTLGIGGLGDVAKREPFNLQPCKEDTGQTLGVWGIGPGPYLILPFLPPLTVRDAVGYFADGAMDPLSYFIPFVWDRLGMKAGDTVNNRALNIDLFQGFEEATVELYSALRNAYLQRRHKVISE